MMQIEKSDTTWKWARCCHDFPQFSVKKNYLASTISTSNSQESLTFLLATDHISPNSEVIRSSSTKVGCRCPHHMNSLSSSFTIIWFSMRYLKSNFKTLQNSVAPTLTTILKELRTKKDSRVTETRQSWQHCQQ